MPLSPEGAFFEERFRLNEDDAPRDRLSCLTVIELATSTLAKAKLVVERVNKKLAAGVSEAEADRLIEKRESALELGSRCADTIQRQSGTLPLRPLSTRHV